MRTSTAASSYILIIVLLYVFCFINIISALNVKCLSLLIDPAADFYVDLLAMPTSNRNNQVSVTSAPKVRIDFGNNSAVLPL